MLASVSANTIVLFTIFTAVNLSIVSSVLLFSIVSIVASDIVPSILFCLILRINLVLEAYGLTGKVNIDYFTWNEGYTALKDGRIDAFVGSYANGSPISGIIETEGTTTGSAHVTNPNPCSISSAGIASAKGSTPFFAFTRSCHWNKWQKYTKCINRRKRYEKSDCSDFNVGANVSPRQSLQPSWG